ncbi:phosphodiesterase [Actinorugispora endophytica]|uniref:phosphodiesterase n=1 Tax=Actinorugispora endophytica TaxID=1605990 RepID=UPI001AAD0050|nr:phosphodiesterase [Actinorugispora endophytica]
MARRPTAPREAGEPLPRLPAALFRRLARARRARAFHPRGLWLTGELTAGTGGLLPLPEGTRPVVARLSKGAGVPGGGADVLGLAVRIPHGEGLDGPWDLALSASGIGRLTRLLPLPARGWGRARYGSLVPYRSEGRAVWLLAVPRGGDPVAPASLGRLERRVRARPLRFTLLAGAARGGWRPVARLTLDTVLPEAGRLSFDPVLNRPPGLEMAPRWLAEAREAAYRGSRSGRRAPEEPRRRS